MDEVLEWLKVAKSNLKMGKSYYILLDKDIRLEEFCYDLQQCVEKSLKALLLYHKIKFPKTHVISELIDLLRINSVRVPEKLLDAVELTQYAVETRYPDNYKEITLDEYKEAFEIAEAVYKWVEEQVK